MAGELVLAKTFIEIGYKGFDDIEKHARDAVQVFQRTLKQESQTYRDSGQDWVDATFTIKPTKLQSLGGQLKAEFAGIGKSIVNSLKPLKEYMDDNMAGAFRRGATSILDFTRAGSPLAFNTLGASIELLKARIGTSFTPVILSASKSVQDFSKWIQNLDPETKKTIATWTSVAVVGAGLYAVFGKLVVSVGQLAYSFATFAINNPLTTSLLGVSAAAAKAYTDVKKLDQIKEDNTRTRNRLATGGMTQDDVEGSWYARKLEQVKDPQERAKRARQMLGSLQKQGSALEEQYGAVINNPLDAATSLAGASAKDPKEIAKEMAGINKELQIVANYLNAAVKGESPTVKAGATKKKDDLMLGAMGGAGTRAGSMSLDSSYNALNNLALGQNQIQMQMLKEQQMSNKTALESKNKIEGIEQVLLRAAGL